MRLTATGTDDESSADAGNSHNDSVGHNHVDSIGAVVLGDHERLTIAFDNPHNQAELGSRVREQLLVNGQFPGQDLLDGSQDSIVDVCEIGRGQQLSKACRGGDPGC